VSARYSILVLFSFVYPVIDSMATPAETSRMVAVPTVLALDCNVSLVLINTLAATAAIRTIAMKTISVPIPTIPISSFLRDLLCFP